MASDQELADRVRARDADAFEALYDAHHRLVYGIALRILADPDAAEDVTQNVFLKFWNSPAAFAGGNFSAWLSRVARNRAIDELRWRAGRSEAALPPEIRLESDPFDEVALAVDGARARAALASLPPEQREPIELGFFEGLTHVEIAARSGAPLGTIKTRIRSGLRTLRTALATGVA